MLQSVDTFIFDLDHTLYDAEDVFKKMHLRMSGYVASLLDISYDEADKIRNQFYQQYGTTLHGLMNEHNINPHDYLDYVHDLDVSIVEKCADTVKMIQGLPGRKLVYTNASIEHADNILQHLEMSHLFEAIFDIKAADLICKPNKSPYEVFIKRYDLTPENCVMFEDTAKNLKTAREVGFKTVWMSHGRDIDENYKDYIDATYTNVKHWLDDYYQGKRL